MSDEPNANDDEAFVDPDKGQCRRHRRSSVQFIDKNLIRRRSSGNDKSGPQQRLLSFDTPYELDDRDRLEHYCETQSQLETTVETFCHSLRRKE